MEEMVVVMRVQVKRRVEKRRKNNKRERRWEEKSVATIYHRGFYCNRSGILYFPSRLYNPQW